MKENANRFKKATQLIHAGQEPDPSTGAVMTPVFMTSTYVQEAPNVHQGYDYSRAGNPTRKALEDNLAAIENGKYGYAFSSGMGAVDAVLKLLNPGDEVLATSDLYGGTFRLFTQTFSRYGVKFKFLDFSDMNKVAAEVTPATKMIWAETPTNPLLHIIDLSACSELCRAHNLLLVADNTFASPWLQNPLDLGADIVMHSMTKYLGGHSDLVMGGLICNREDLSEALYFNQKSTGATPGPMDCFLALRGIKTLHLRMQAHCANARQVVKYLNSHPKVGKVYYPGLETHPGHAVAAAQMRDFGGMVSFELANSGRDTTFAFMQATQLFTLAESLGGVESLVCHPASMTHASIPVEVREKAGITEGLIRLSVGVEDAEDLLNDLEQALAGI
jgi:cystathionine gamma-lyase